MKEFEISDVRFQQIAKFLLFCFPLKVYDISTSEQPLKLSSVNFTMQTLQACNTVVLFLKLSIWSSLNFFMQCKGRTTQTEI